MIEYKVGDILLEDAEALVNTVNCVGFMGRGIALEFKRVYPDNFKEYEAACRRKEVEPGRMMVHQTGKLTNPRYIINFPTKRHWRGKSRMEDIERGLEALVDVIESRGIRSIAIPPLGSGLGGLDWPDVRSRIEDALHELQDVKVVVYEPHRAPVVTDRRESRVPVMTSGRATLVGLIDRYLKGLLDPFVTLLEVHKLMYFMQEAGEPLRLRLVKGPYGPYAENLRNVLQAVEGYYVSGYGSGGDEPGKRLELVPGAALDAERWLEDNGGSQVKFNRVANLVDGFESPFGLELLATVHWVAVREHPTDSEELVEQVYRWAERKRRFAPEQIELAHAVLLKKGWLGSAQTSS